MWRAHPTCPLLFPPSQHLRHHPPCPLVVPDGDGPSSSPKSCSAQVLKVLPSGVPVPVGEASGDQEGLGWAPQCPSSEFQHGTRARTTASQDTLLMQRDCGGNGVVKGTFGELNYLEMHHVLRNGSKYFSTTHNSFLYRSGPYRKWNST